MINDYSGWLSTPHSAKFYKLLKAKFVICTSSEDVYSHCWLYYSDLKKNYQ